MQHVGNDIVDLTDSDAMGKSRDTRFINRVFTQGEQDRILNSANPDAALWALWAGKETAYKVVSKSHTAVSSAPRAYNVSFEKENIANSDRNSFGHYSFSGVVETPRGSIPVRIFQACDCIHCIGTTGAKEAIDSVDWGVLRIGRGFGASPRFESFIVRKAARRHLSLYLNRYPDEIEIRRVKGPHGSGYPIVYIGDRRAGVDISLSHEGEFAAYAFVTYGAARSLAGSPQNAERA